MYERKGGTNFFVCSVWTLPRPLLSGVAVLLAIRPIFQHLSSNSKSTSVSEPHKFADEVPRHSLFGLLLLSYFISVKDIYLMNSFLFIILLFH